jgi:ubiquinone/menaquinone biosynthesis C-methylase UbiE
MAETTQLQFTGSIPQNYDDFLGPMFFEPYAEDIGNVIGTLTIHNAFEIASGTGRLTRHLRNLLPATTRLIASDISEDMLAVAQSKLKGFDIDWKIIDAQSLPFEDNSFDLVVCYFGYMMVPDKEKAYAEAFRILKKGGMLVMATWDKLDSNEASYIFRMALKQYLGDTLPESYKVPFSMYDSELISTMLKRAGFSSVDSEKVGKKSVAENSEKAAYGLVRGGSLYRNSKT